MTEFQTVEHLTKFVRDEEEKIEYTRRIFSLDETTVACGDPLLKTKAVWRLVGGGANLFLKGLLPMYIGLRTGKSGVIEAHINCAWMFVNGFQTESSQWRVISGLMQQVEKLNYKFDANFIVPQPDHIGSAKQFMIHN